MPLPATRRRRAFQVPPSGLDYCSFFTPCHGYVVPPPSVTLGTRYFFVTAVSKRRRSVQWRGQMQLLRVARPPGPMTACGCSAERRGDGCDGASHIALRRPPAAHRDPHAALAPPDRAREHGLAAGVDPGHDLDRTLVVVRFTRARPGIEEAQQALIDDRLGYHLHP